MPLFTTEVTGVVTFVSWARGGLALLEALDKGMNFSLGEGQRQCLGVLGVSGRRPLTHTLVCKVADVIIDKSFAAEVGSSSSMLHKSNLLEFIFQSIHHGDKGVVVHLIAIGKEEGREDAQAQLVVPDASCGEGLTTVSYIKQHVCDVLSGTLLWLKVL